MLRTANPLRYYSVKATDGELGRIRDFYFEDNTWTVRYLVADTGRLVAGRQVLLSPYAVQKLNDDERIIELNLNRKQIENSPPIQADQPVSRQFEEQYARYYGWALYWEGPWLWGPTTTPTVVPPGQFEPAPEGVPPLEPSGNPHLRSVAEVSKYRLHAMDGELGHVEDVIIEDHDWTMRYLVVDTRNWWPGKHVLVAPRWIREVRWSDSHVEVNLNRQSIKEAPAFDPAIPVTKEYEAAVLDYYDQRVHASR